MSGQILASARTLLALFARYFTFIMVVGSMGSAGSLSRIVLGQVRLPVLWYHLLSETMTQIHVVYDNAALFYIGEIVDTSF